ncbi:MAG: aminotransferase class V-fold PLP-dependent enzyme [Polyangiaceae bacterium]
MNAVARAYGESPIVPRGPRFAPLLARVRAGIRRRSRPPSTSPCCSGTGSTAIAAVLGSCLRPTERLLVIRNGAYGDRIFEYASRLGQPVVDMELPYGQRPDLGRVDALLASNEVDAVAVVYGGTSTCTLNPLAEIGRIAKARGKKLLVDGVSALFVEPMELAAWGISAVMGSCNKGLHSHPNLTMALVERSLMADMADIPQRARASSCTRSGKRRPAAATLHHRSDRPAHGRGRASRSSPRRAASRGATRFIRRAQQAPRGYSASGSRSRWENVPLGSIGTALKIPSSTTYDAMADRLATEEFEGHVFEIYSAQGKLSKQLFRIFHMGDYELEVYDVFLKALARVL